MRYFKYLLSYRSQNTEWPDAVIARLDSLAAAQNDLRKQLADHAADGQPTPDARKRGASYLAIIVLLIIFSVTALIFSPIFQSRAARANNQAQAALEQTNKDLQPIRTAESKYGAKYVLDHMHKALLTDLRTAGGADAKSYQDSINGNDLESYSFLSEYFGQTVLAISSACFGAIAGWLLIPELVRGRSLIPELVRGRSRRTNRTTSGGGRIKSSPSS